MRHVRDAVVFVVAAGLAGCAESGPPAPGSPTIASVIAPQSATVGVPLTFDATKGGTVFADPSDSLLTYSIAIHNAPRGLTANGGQVTGTPSSAGVVRLTITATNDAGKKATQDFAIAAFAAGLASPTLPPQLFPYSDARAPLPTHITNIGGITLGIDNMPVTNVTTDAGATLGRVLFYDRRLSGNDAVACASCHLQQFAFADTARFSRGFKGGLTGRHSPSLINARFYSRGRAFWDERASSFEDLALRPIQDTVEMGLTLDDLVAKLQATSYYPPLFTAAFGSGEISSDRVARAIAQFVRSIRGFQSRFDATFAGQPLTGRELDGQIVFLTSGCSSCHFSNAHVSDNIHNTGLDSAVTDVGAGLGRFKAPSLRNIALSAPYMHDGRFKTLEEVVNFYDAGVQNNPNLDARMRVGAAPRRLNLTWIQREALVAFLRTLTDSTLSTTPKFSNPFLVTP